MLLLPALAFSQVEIVPFAGYMFGGSINYNQGRLNLDNSLNYGGSLIVPVDHLVCVELNYTRMSSNLSFTANPSFYPQYQAAGLGVKVMFTDRIGIMLRGRLMLPMMFRGVGAYFGFGTGGSSGGLTVSTYSSFVQGDFNGGLVFMLGHDLVKYLFLSLLLNGLFYFNK